MKKLPNDIKIKLRQLQKACEKASSLEREVCGLIESYGVDIDFLNANYYDINTFTRKPSTEALAYIVKPEGTVEENIRDIEKVFLWHYKFNKENNSEE